MQPNLPKSVQRQLEEANRIEQEMAARPAPTPEPDIGDTLAQTTVEVPPPVAAAPAPVQPPATPAPEQRPQPDPWEHKYKVLQGMFNAQVPQLQREVGELKGQLQQAIAQLQQASRKPEPEPAAPRANPSTEDIDAFGAQMMEMVHRIADQKVAAAGRHFITRAEFAQLEQRLQGTTATAVQSADTAFESTLLRLVPDYEAINADERWLAWLGETDPMLGAPRQMALDDAVNARDARRTANIFKAFIATQAPVATVAPPSPLESQITPSAAGAAAPAPSAPPILTQAQIVQFYDEVRRGPRGKYAGRPEEVVRIEAEINRAIAEGRVR